MIAAELLMVIVMAHGSFVMAGMLTYEGEQEARYV